MANEAEFRTKALLIMGDAVSLVRSLEVRRSLSGVTFENLINDHLEYLGETQGTADTQYDPYSYLPGEEPATASEDPVVSSNPGSGVLAGSGGRPSRIRRLALLKEAVIGLARELEAAPDTNFGLEMEDIVDGTDQEGR